MNKPEAVRQMVERQPTYPELRTQTPEQRTQYLKGMVETIERKYPEMDPGARRAIAFFLTEITPIVRPPGREDAMRERLIQWATEHPSSQELQIFLDKGGNLLIEIAATPGYEDMPGILIQSHMDMQIAPSAADNPGISPALNPVIPVFIDDEKRIKAAETTLGADDGLGIGAAIQAGDEILTDQSLPHGKIGLMFTTGEEDGLKGAMALSFEKEQLKGYEYLLNIDNEDSHEALVGAAGGKSTEVILPITREATKEDRHYLSVAVDNLLGGHSGADIHFGRLNAIKVIAKLLADSSKTMDVRLVTISGGTAASAIPENAKVTVAIPPGQEEAFAEALQKAEEAILEGDTLTKEQLSKSSLVKPKEKKKNKLATEEPRIVISEAKGEVLNTLPMTSQSTQELLALITALPHGVLEADEKYHIVKTSINLGLITTESTESGEVIHITNMARSSSSESLDQTTVSVLNTAQAHNAQATEGEISFNPWEPDFDDPLIRLAKTAHSQDEGKELSVTVIHAGLESYKIYERMQDILGEDMPKNFHMLSIGPSLENPHGTREEFAIAEAAEFFPWARQLLHEILHTEAVKRGLPFPKEQTVRRTSAQ